MAVIETWYNQDLSKPVKVHYLDGNVFSQDNAGNLVGVNVFDNDEPATLSGTVSASVIRADGATVAVSGTLSGNQCYVILPETAYYVPGVISIVIKLTSGTTKTTLCAVVGNVYRSATGTTVDPGTIMPSIQTLLAEIADAVASIPADYSELWETLAPAFDTNKNYVVGQFVTYDGAMYRFVNDHSGAWAAADVTAVNIGAELTAANSALSTISNENNALNVAEYPVYNCTVRDTSLLSVSGVLYQSVEIPTFNRFDKLTVTAGEKSVIVCFFKKSLPSAISNGMNVTSYFATGETGRHVVAASTTETFNVPSDTAFIVVSIKSNGESTVPASVVGHNKLFEKKPLGILVLGNSFSQDIFAYLPPVLNELLPDYAITYGVAYSSSAGPQEHVDMYNNNTKYTWFNYWKPGNSKWTRYASGGTPDNGKTLTDILALATWNIVYVQPHGSITTAENVKTNNVYPGRRLLRLLQNIVGHTFAFMMGQWLIESNENMEYMKNAMETIKSNLGVDHIIPVGTGIANARTNTTLNAIGESTVFDPPRMLFDDTHQQAGLPTLISTYVIAAYLLKILGVATTSVYDSSWMPTTENCIAINANKVEGYVTPRPMTHGNESQGVTTDNVRAAQEIAILAVNNPFVVTDCSLILTMNP